MRRAREEEGEGESAGQAVRYISLITPSAPRENTQFNFSLRRGLNFLSVFADCGREVGR